VTIDGRALLVHLVRLFRCKRVTSMCLSANKKANFTASNGKWRTFRYFCHRWKRKKVVNGKGKKEVSLPQLKNGEQKYTFVVPGNEPIYDLTIKDLYKFIFFEEKKQQKQDKSVGTDSTV
jgi:hypothetical protein